MPRSGIAPILARCTLHPCWRRNVHVVVHMSMHARRQMTVDEFLAWAEGQEGRWEFYNGVPYPMPLEGVGHSEVRFAVHTALLRGCRRSDLECHMLGRGVGVRVSPHAMHIPDALVYCGPTLPGDAIEVPNPVILFEVLSPFRKVSASQKLEGYFSLPSVHHFLILDPKGPPVVRYSRQADGTLSRSAVHEGTLTLSPPGIELSVAEMFALEL
jgi:Uma2 family endonuclease